MNNTIEELEEKFKEVQNTQNKLFEKMNDRITLQKSIINIQDKLLEHHVDDNKRLKNLLVLSAIWIIVSTIINILHLL